MAHRQVQSAELTPARSTEASASRIIPWSLGALATLASVGALWNGYTYDDRWVILGNPRVHALGSIWRLFGQTYWPPSNAAALYRPIPMVGFTVAWGLGHGAPWVLHALTVMLYVAVTLAVWRLAREILPPSAAWAAWVAAALFAVHPVHVDATGNAVGQAELWATLWCVLGVGAYLRWRSMGGPLSVRQVAGLGAFYALACCSKEHGIVFPVLLAAAECTLVRDPRPWRAAGGSETRPYVNPYVNGGRLRSFGGLAGVLLIVAVGYLVVRRVVVGSLTGDYPTFVFAHAPLSTRVWTMLGAVMQWARLFFWPVRLAAEYAPREITIYTVPAWVLVWPTLLILAVAGVAMASRRRAPVVTFGVLWLAIALLPTSNILVVTGVIIAERTMFLASVGLVLALGGGVAALVSPASLSPAGRRLGVAALALVIGAGLARSMVRQRDWRDDATLIERGVLDMPLSYRAHYTYGHLLFANEQWEAGARQMRLAIALYGGDPQPYAELGTAYGDHGMCALAEPLFRRALDILPKHPDARYGLARCLLQDRDYAGARSQAMIGLSHGYNVVAFRGLIVSVDSARASSTVVPSTSPLPPA